MFSQNKITHLNKMQLIYYICFPALKCLSPKKAAGKQERLRKPWVLYPTAQMARSCAPGRQRHAAAYMPSIKFI